MKYLSARVKGFKAIKDEIVIDNFENINVIFGENYSGKTSLLTALVLPFIGKKALEKGRKLEEYINDYSDGFSIEIKFSHKDSIYLYTYQYSRKSNSKTLKLDNEIVAEGVSPVDDYINTHICDSDMLANSSIASQRSENDFLFQDKAKRLEILRKILGIDVLDDSIKSLKESVKEKDKNIAIKESEINILKSQNLTPEIVPDIPADYDKVILDYNHLTQIKSEADKAKDYINKVDINRKYITDKQSNINQIGNNIQAKQKELSGVRSKLNGNQLEELKIKITENKALLSSKESEERKLLSDINEYTLYLERNKDINVLKRKLAIQETELEKLGDIVPLSDLENKIKESDEYISDFMERRAGITNKIKEDQDHLALIEQGIDKCPTCHQEVKATPTTKEELLTAIKVTTEHLNTINSDLEKCKKIKDETSIKLQEAKDHNTKIFNLRTDNETLRIEIESKSTVLKVPEHNKEELDKLLTEIQDTIGKSKLQLEEQENTLKELENLEYKSKSISDDINNLTTQLKDLNIEVGNLKSQINESEYAKYKNLLSSFDESAYLTLQIKKQEYDLTLQSRDLIIKRNEEVEKQIEANRSQVTLKTKEIVELTSDIEKDKAAIVLAQKYASARINKGLTSIVDMMNSFISNIHDSFEIKLESENDAEIVYMLEGNDSWKSTYMASGFEKQLLAGAWKVALSHLNNMRILMLDEADDAAGIENSIRLFEGFVEQNFDQIFIITHKPETIEFLQNDYNARLIKIEKGKVVE